MPTLLDQVKGGRSTRRAADRNSRRKHGSLLEQVSKPKPKSFPPPPPPLSSLSYTAGAQWATPPGKPEGYVNPRVAPEAIESSRRPKPDTAPPIEDVTRPIDEGVGQQQDSVQRVREVAGGRAKQKPEAPSEPGVSAEPQPAETGKVRVDAVMRQYMDAGRIGPDELEVLRRQMRGLSVDERLERLGRVARAAPMETEPRGALRSAAFGLTEVPEAHTRQARQTYASHYGGQPPGAPRGLRRDDKEHYEDVARELFWLQQAQPPGWQKKAAKRDTLLTRLERRAARIRSKATDTPQKTPDRHAARDTLYKVADVLDSARPPKYGTTWFQADIDKLDDARKMLDDMSDTMRALPQDDPLQRFRDRLVREHSQKARAAKPRSILDPIAGAVRQTEQGVSTAANTLDKALGRVGSRVVRGFTRIPTLNRRAFQEIDALLGNARAQELRAWHENPWNVAKPEWFRIDRWEGEGRIDAGEVASKTSLADMLPFVSGDDTMIQLYVTSAAERLKKASQLAKRHGSYTYASQEGDRQLVEDYLARMKNLHDRGYTTPAGVVRTVLDMVPYMAEIGIGLAATGGMSGSMRSGFRSLAKHHAKGRLKNALLSALEKATRGVARAAVMTTMQPDMIARDFVSRRTPPLWIAEDGTLLVGDRKNTAGEDFIRAFAGQWIETASELTGASLGRAGGVAARGAKSALGKAGVLGGVRKLMQRIGQTRMAGRVARVLSHIPRSQTAELLRRVGYNGPLEEMGEERLADVVRALMDIDQEGGTAFERLISSMPGAQQWAIEGWTFSLIPVGAAVARSPASVARRVNANRGMRKRIESLSEQMDEAYAGIEEEIPQAEVAPIEDTRDYQLEEELLTPEAAESEVGEDIAAEEAPAIQEEVEKRAAAYDTEEPAAEAAPEAAAEPTEAAAEPLGQDVDDFRGRAPETNWDASDVQPGGPWTQESVAKHLSIPADEHIYPVMVDLSALSPSRVERTDAEAIRAGKADDMVTDFHREQAEDILRQHTESDTYQPRLHDEWGDFLPYAETYDADDVTDLAREMAAREAETGYDEGEFQHDLGGFPPIVVTRKADGTVEIVDGNHRADIWQQAGYDVAPAWVNDEMAREQRAAAYDTEEPAAEAEPEARAGQKEVERRAAAYDTEAEEAEAEPEARAGQQEVERRAAAYDTEAKETEATAEPAREAPEAQVEGAPQEVAQEAEAATEQQPWEMDADERAEKIARLRRENRESLATPLMSEGGLAPAELGRMSRRQHEKYVKNAQKRMAVEAQIRELQKSDAELRADQKARSASKDRGRLAQLNRWIDDLGRVGISRKTGKLRPKYAKQIEAASKERAELLARNEGQKWVDEALAKLEGEQPAQEAEAEAEQPAETRPPRKTTRAEREAQGKRLVSEDAYKAALNRLGDRSKLRGGLVPFSAQDVADAAKIILYQVENGVYKLSDILKSTRAKNIDDRAVRQAWRNTKETRAAMRLAQQTGNPLSAEDVTRAQQAIEMGTETDLSTPSAFLEYAAKRTPATNLMAARAAARDAVKAHKDLAAYAKQEITDRNDLNQALQSVAKARTPAERRRVATAIYLLGQRASDVRKEVVTLRRKLRKTYGRDYKKMRPQFRDAMQEIDANVGFKRIAGRKKRSMDATRRFFKENPDLPLPEGAREAIESIERKSVYDMSRAELEALRDGIKSMVHQQKLIGKLRRKGRMRDVAEVTQKIAQTAAGEPTRRQPRTRFGRWWRRVREKSSGAAGYMFDRLEGRLMTLDGKERGGAAQTYIYDSLRDSMNQMIRLMDGAKGEIPVRVRQLLQQYGLKTDRRVVEKMYANGLTQPTVRTVELPNGDTLRTTGGTLVSIVLTRRDTTGSGGQPGEQLLTNPKGFFYQEADKHERSVEGNPLTPADLDAIEAALTPQERACVEAWDGEIRRELADRGNRAWMRDFGYENFTNPTYYPIYRHSADVGTEAVQLDLMNPQTFGSIGGAVTNWRATKERGGGQARLRVRDFFRVLAEHEQHMAMLEAYGETVGNLRRLFGDRNFKLAVDQTLGPKGRDQLLGGIRRTLGQEMRTSDPAERFLGRARGRASQSIIPFSPSVIVAQATSFLHAMNEQGPGFMRYLRPLTPEEHAEVDKVLTLEYSPDLYRRAQGYISREMGEVMNGRKLSVMFTENPDRAFDKIKKGVTGSDQIPVRRIVADNLRKGRKKGLTGDALYRFAARESEYSVRWNQPAFNPIDRTDFGGTESQAIKTTVGMFRSYRDTVLSNVRKAFIEYAGSRRTKADRAKLSGRLVNSLVVNAAVNMVRKNAWRVAKGSAAFSAAGLLLGVRPDDEDDEKEKRKWYSIVGDTLVEVAGLLPVLGGALYKLRAGLRGDWWANELDVIESPVFGALDDAVEGTALAVNAYMEWQEGDVYGLGSDRAGEKKYFALAKRAAEQLSSAAGIYAGLPVRAMIGVGTIFTSRLTEDKSPIQRAWEDAKSDYIEYYLLRSGGASRAELQKVKARMEETVKKLNEMRPEGKARLAIPRKTLSDVAGNVRGGWTRERNKYRDRAAALLLEGLPESEAQAVIDEYEEAREEGRKAREKIRKARKENRKVSEEVREAFETNYNPCKLTMDMVRKRVESRK
ncbi:MAG: ParB N-terminal domain-containing protein [Phycisphaerae bacterium]|nr:ParB N-terminal domain-containing protein [Phycisphaerae bacterium]